jgi:hypothetical protein
MSTAAERVFSQGRHLLSFTQNRMTLRTIRSCLCLGSWSRNDLIAMEDIVSVVEKKKKKKIAADESVEV